MKKVYICPEIELVMPKFTKDMMQLPEHSEGDADARQNDFFDEEEEGMDYKSRNLWDE